MDWTDKLIDRLRDLWAQGLPTAEIGRQLSTSKNAVVGKAHRLKLPPRPSPIRARTAEGEAKVPKTRKETVQDRHGRALTEEAKEPTARKVTARGEAKKARKPQLPLEGGHVGEAKKAPIATRKTVRAKIEQAELSESSSDSVISPAEGASKKKIPVQPIKEEPEIRSEGKTEQIAGQKMAEVKKTSSSTKAAPSARRLRDTLDSGARQGPTCQWPTGNPGEPDFHFCGAVPIPGKPYCVEHAAIAYVKIRDKRD